MYYAKLLVRNRCSHLDIQYKDYDISIDIDNSVIFTGFNRLTDESLDYLDISSIDDYLGKQDNLNNQLYLSDEVKYKVVDELINRQLLDNLDDIVQRNKVKAESQDEDYFLTIFDAKDSSKVTGRYDAYRYYDSGLIYLIDKLTLTQYFGSYDEIVNKLKEDLTDWDIKFDGFEYDSGNFIKQVDEPKDEEDELDDTDQNTKDKEIESELITAEDCANVNWPGKDEDGFCDKVLQILRFKRAILLQGPPGTGKTKIAEALAYKWFNRNDGRIATSPRDKTLPIGAELMYDITPVDSYHFCEVQFSEEYSYSDFVEGLKPDEETGNWKMIPGPLKSMCDRARENPNQKFILFIDEINRANTEAVIGEMLNLMEKRDRNITLKSGSRLSMPYNLYIIATMNTIDRGAGTLNFATISRFAEIDIDSNSKKYGTKGSKLTADDILTHKLSPVVSGDSGYAELADRLTLLMEILDRVNTRIAQDTQVSANNADIKIGYRCLYTGYQNSEELNLAAEFDLLPELKSRHSRLSDKNYDDCRKAIEKFYQGNIKQMDDIENALPIKDNRV